MLGSVLTQRNGCSELGLRAQRGTFTLDAFAALPAFGKQIINKSKVRFGLTAGVGF